MPERDILKPPLSLASRVVSHTLMAKQRIFSGEVVLAVLANPLLLASTAVVQTVLGLFVTSKLLEKRRKSQTGSCSRSRSSTYIVGTLEGSVADGAAFVNKVAAVRTRRGLGSTTRAAARLSRLLARHRGLHILILFIGFG